jgi:hypothetical protein
MRLPRKVYAIQHNETKRIYIGSSYDVETRYLNHLYALRNHKHNNEDMQQDFDEFGEDYSLYVIDEITTFEDVKREYEWMKKYKSYIRGTGYNYKDQKKIEEKTKIPFKEGLPELPNNE